MDRPRTMTADPGRRSGDDPPRTIQVLILEDVPVDAELMLRELRNAGFDPHWSRVDTESQYVTALSPDLDVVLADYRLPQFDALGALEHLKESGWDVPFIIVSGAISEEAAVESMKQGAADYVLKDRMRRLGQAVARALEDRERRRARDKAERALRDSEEKFRLLVEGAEDFAIVMLDPEGLVTHWNAGAERIHGWRAHEILGQPVMRFWRGEDAARGAPEAALELAATEGRFAERGWRVRRDGSTFWADVVIVPLQHANGELRGFAAVTRDVTERRRAEEALARRSDELARTNAELGVFTHVVSHDLAGPLRAIASDARALAQHVRGRLDPESERALAAISEAAERVQALVADVLAYAHAHDTGSVFVATDCERVLAAALDKLTPALTAAGIAVTHDALPSVTADGAQLGQVFETLVRLALRDPACGARRVHVSAERVDGMWRFGVAHDRAVLSGQEAAHAFDLLDRLHARGESPEPGVALAICRKIVERHGGSIGVETDPAHGTTIHFTIPAAPQDA
ncbi:MAG TPA: PAS domain S-box protein [Candidatus Eisenbacteria bacterium]|nr:PAS domain S-box protein [Candidatus Eisenbacteria bacterium]